MLLFRSTAIRCIQQLTALPRLLAQAYRGRYAGNWGLVTFLTVWPKEALTFGSSR